MLSWPLDGGHPQARRGRSQRARSGTRTRTPLRTMVFETIASADSAIRAGGLSLHIVDRARCQQVRADGGRAHQPASGSPQGGRCYQSRRDWVQLLVPCCPHRPHPSFYGGPA